MSPTNPNIREGTAKRNKNHPHLGLSSLQPECQLVIRRGRPVPTHWIGSPKSRTYQGFWLTLTASTKSNVVFVGTLMATFQSRSLLVADEQRRLTGHGCVALTAAWSAQRGNWRCWRRRSRNTGREWGT